jgi:cysteine desulfurase / selenocysteine lyase
VTLDVRKDFPLLERTFDGKPVTYLDSAATSLKPRAVLEAEAAYSTRFTSNVHRGKHALSEEASDAYERARRTMARFLNADPASVIFTRNTTEGLNLVASGLRLRPDDRVLAPVSEHHSNLLPWMRLAKLTVFDCDVLRPLSPEEVERLIETHRPSVLALGMMSNVTGVVQPVEQICKIARAHKVITVIDAAQAAAHCPLDVETLGCDFLALSGHKMLGPTGVGLLWGRPELLESLDPLLLGGGTVATVTKTGFTLKNVPDRFEAGTPNISGAIGLAAAADYLENLGFEAIAVHDRAVGTLLRKIVRDLPSVRVLMAESQSPAPIASLALSVPTLSADQVALVLSDSYQTMVRSGFFCARPLFDSLGLSHGALRASAYVYNTEDDLRRFGVALTEILGRLTR